MIEALTSYVIQFSLMMLMVTVFDLKANYRCFLDFFTQPLKHTHHGKNKPLQILTKFAVDGQMQWCLRIMAMTAVKIRSMCMTKRNRNLNKERKKLN